MSAAERRESLLDIALDLLLNDGEPAITIGAVAERAEVTRTLVYKHFENRTDLIVALYRRESRRLLHELSELVANAPGGFEPKLRAMVRGLLFATDRWGTIFNPLRHSGAGPIGRQSRRERDRRTAEYFAELAAAEYDLQPERALQAVRVAFGGLDPLMWMVRPDMTGTDRDRLVDLYVEMTTAALAGSR